MYGAVAAAAFAGSLFVALTMNLPRRARWTVRMLPVSAGAVTMIAAGASLIAATGGGLYWLAATVLIYVLRSALDAGELLIEASGTPRA